ncbi:MAG TPA: zinc ribbon domain-containing protein [Firmicutes bacterium]|nr:zinc ribbon domain-containing protein [Bacillota bacterium]
MPYYEYRCRDCGERFEVRAPMSAKPAHPVCNRCHGTNTQPVYSTFAVGGGGGARDSSSGACASCHGGQCSSCH